MLILAAAALAAPVSAQSDLKVTPIGRVQVDGALYSPEGHGFNPGMVLSEVRSGVKANIGDWMTRIEIGYAFGKLGMKDTYLHRNFGDNAYMRVGYFIPEFGIRGSGSASYKPGMIATVSESFFRTMTRKIGVMYDHAFNYGALSSTAFVGGRSMTLNATQQGEVSVGAIVRGVAHTPIQRGGFAQLGMSAFYESASHTSTLDEFGDETVSPGFREFSAKYPTAVSSVPLLTAKVENAVGDIKLSPEVIASYGPVALESQYFYLNMPRTDRRSAYKAQGAFGILRCLVAGDKEYGYNRAASNLKDPAPGSVELVASYDYTDATSPESGIYGGISNDWSLTANYYLNRCITARLRAGYTTLTGAGIRSDHSVASLQARLQFVF